MKLTLLLTVSAFAFGATPTLYFTDLDSGPKTGGESNNGSYVTLYGQHFGTNTGSAGVTVGGGAVIIKSWGATWMNAAGDRPLEKIVIQLGPSAATGAVVVTDSTGHTSTCVNRDTSNACNFTVRSGNIHFVATAGNGGSDSNPGTFASPWLTLIHVRFTAVAGDVTYLRQGVAANTNDDFSACFNPSSQGGTAGNPQAIVGYPGETATIGTTTPSSMGGCDFGIRTHSGNASESYWTFAEMNILGTFAIASSGAGGAGRVTNWRIIGNDISCPTGTGAAGCYGAGNNDHISIWGNYFHNLGVGPSASSLYQGVYFGDVSHDLLLGWNTIKTILGCRAIQTNSSTPGDALYSIAIHDNSIHDGSCDGMVLVSLDLTTGTGVNVYNNLIYNVGLSNMTGGGGAWMCINAQDYGPTGGTGNIEAYNNTMYACGTNPTPTFSPGANNGIDMIGGMGNAAKHLRIRNDIIRMTTGPMGNLNYWTQDDGAGNSCPSNNCGRILGTNNLMFGLALPVTNTDIIGTLNSDPLFTNTGTLDFTLQSGSPAKGTGITISGLVYDFNGLPYASPSSMGAFEAGSGGGGGAGGSSISGQVTIVGSGIAH